MKTVQYTSSRRYELDQNAQTICVTTLPPVDYNLRSLGDQFLPDLLASHYVIGLGKYHDDPSDLIGYLAV